MEHLIRLVISGVKYNAISTVVVLPSYLLFEIVTIIFNKKGKILT